MPVSLYQPDVVVEIAFTSGYATAAASRVWTDVSAYVENTERTRVQRGRQNEVGAVTASQLSLTLDNRDGRFTPENTAGAYYPNVKLGRPIRLRTKPVGAGAYTDQFMGYVTEWPVAWPDGSNLVSTVTITASSRMARLGRGLEFKSIVEEEILYDVPIWHFPLGEAAGATQAGNIAPGRSERLSTYQVGAGGTLVFGAGIGPSTDDLTAPVFTPAGVGNGVILAMQAAEPLIPTTYTVVDIECWFITTTSNQIVYLNNSTALGAAGITASIGIFINAGKATTVMAAGGLSATAASVATVTDGLLHHAQGRVVIGGGNMTASMMLDAEARVTGASQAYAGSSFPDLRQVNVGSGGTTAGASMFAGTIAHFAVTGGTVAMTDARVQQRYLSGLNGFTTDASGARVSRYARLAGVPTAEISVETGLSTSIAHEDTTGQTAVEMMQKVAETEDGLVFDGKDGTLTFHARSRRYASTSAFTLSVTAGEVEANLSPAMDDQGTTNDVTATRTDGGARAHAVNQASIAEYGYYRDSLDLMTTSDNEVQSRADWQVNRFGTPRVKLTGITVDLINSSTAQQTLLLAADLGTRFTVTNLPSQAPATTMQFFIEGITLDIGPESFTISFNTSAADYANVWTLDSSTLSQLDQTTVLAY